jgi:hypothetical protein
MKYWLFSLQANSYPKPPGYLRQVERYLKSGAIFDFNAGKITQKIMPQSSGAEPRSYLPKKAFRRIHYLCQDPYPSFLKKPLIPRNTGEKQKATFLKIAAVFKLSNTNILRNFGFIGDPS